MSLLAVLNIARVMIPEVIEIISLVKQGKPEEAEALLAAAEEKLKAAGVQFDENINQIDQWLEEHGYDVPE